MSGLRELLGEFDETEVATPREMVLEPMTGQDLFNWSTSLVRLAVTLAHESCDNRQIRAATEAINAAAGVGKMIADSKKDSDDKVNAVSLSTSSLLELLERERRINGED